MQEDPFSPGQNDFNAPEALPQNSVPINTEISWTASEYIAHHKTAQWYLILGAVALVVAAVVWLLTKDEISAVVVLAGAAVLGVYAARPPQVLQYRLNSEALIIGPKIFRLADFRSFSVDDQQAFSSVNLIPLKRFAPGIALYYSPDDENAIVEILASVLPMEPHKADLIDKLMHHIRF